MSAAAVAQATAQVARSSRGVVRRRSVNCGRPSAPAGASPCLCSNISTGHSSRCGKGRRGTCVDALVKRAEHRRFRRFVEVALGGLAHEQLLGPMAASALLAAEATRIYIPISSNCQACRSSRRLTSRISHSRSRRPRPVTGVTTSTRRERLRNIQSAEPMKKSPSSGSSAPAAKWKIRGCSRNRPMIDRTRTFSLHPRTPGLRQQKPRTRRSTGTPGRSGNERT